MDLKDVGNGNLVAALKFNTEELAEIVDEYFSNLAGEEVHIDAEKLDQEFQIEIANKHAEEYVKQQYGDQNIKPIRIPGEMKTGKKTAKPYAEISYIVSRGTFGKLISEGNFDDKTNAELRRLADSNTVLACVSNIMEKSFNIAENIKRIEKEMRDMCVPEDMIESLSNIVSTEAVMFGKSVSYKSDKK